MKKLILSFILFVASLTLISQPAGKWATDGNAIQPGDFFGTLNNIPLDFRTNNVKQMSLGINGILSLNALSGVGNRILITDANGNITALPTGGPGQFLLSDGTWSSLPLSATAWTSVGSNLAYMGGNLGIGTTSPSYKLDVNGDARISSNLFVGGGIIVTDKLDASVHVKAGDVIVNNDLNVAGNSRLSGSLTSPRGLMFDNSNGITFTTSAGTSLYRYGPGGPSIPGPGNPCLPNTPLVLHQFSNAFQVYDNDPNLGYIGGSILTLQSWLSGSSIDVSGLGTGLLLNYFCGKDIYLGTGTGTGGAVGTAGASVYTGDKFYARKNVQIGNPGVALDPNVSLNVFVNGTTSALKLWSNANPNVKLIHDNYDQFIVMGDGRTEITTGAPDAFTIKNSTTGPINFKVKSNGFVYAREINVQTSGFPDYVFEKSYKLLTISELDNYIAANKHLPGFKKAEEYVKDGINVNEVLIKQQEKLEELTLYIIELKKEVENLKTNK